MSFSFVSRIIEIEPGKWARGEYVPPNERAATRWAAAEATGQLAGWVAMAQAQFRRRLVAAVVGVVEIGADWPADEPLALDVEVRPREEVAVSYGGSASARGRMVARLGRCLAPLLAGEEFDDPEAVRRRFDLLCAGGIVEPTFDDPFDRLRIEPLDAGDARALRARMTIPLQAPFLADHFPRQPVLPATLLSEAQVRLALDLAARVANRNPSTLRLRCLRHFKVRAFSRPGQVLVLGARVQDVSEDCIDVAVDAVCDGKTIATARAEITGPGSA